MDEQFSADRLTVEEPEGFTQVPDSLLLNTAVSDGAYRLYAVLKHHARASNSAFPGRKRLAAALGVKSLRTVDARVAELKQAGYITVTHRYHPLGGQTSSDYHLFFYPRLGAAARLGAKQGTTAPAPVQVSAPGECSDLHGDDANRCAESEQVAAHQRSTSIQSTTNPTPTRSGPSQPDAADSGGGAETSSGPADAAPRPAAIAAAADPAVHAFVEAVIYALPSQLFPRTRSQHAEVSTLLEPLAASWEPGDLARQLVAARQLPEVVTHPVGLLRSRLGELPAKPAAKSNQRTPWCGDSHCDQGTRLHYDPQTDTVRRCPHCHPRRSDS